MKKNIATGLSGFALIFTSLLTFCGEGKDEVNEKSVDFILLEKEIKITKDIDVFELDVSLVNRTDSAYILYAFKRVDEAISDEKFLMTDSITSGNEIYVLDSTGKMVYPSDFTLGDPILLRDSISENYPAERTALTSEERFDLGKVVVRPQSKIDCISLEVNFKDHNLDVGIYSIYLLYHSGIYLYSIIPESKVRSQEKKYSAQAYKGWFKSDTVRLVVE